MTYADGGRSGACSSGCTRAVLVSSWSKGNCIRVLDGLLWGAVCTFVSTFGVRRWSGLHCAGSGDHLDGFVNPGLSSSRLGRQTRQRVRTGMAKAKVSCPWTH